MKRLEGCFAKNDERKVWGHLILATHEDRHEIGFEVMLHVLYEYLMELSISAQLTNHCYEIGCPHHHLHLLRSDLFLYSFVSSICGRISFSVSSSVIERGVFDAIRARTSKLH